MENPKTDQAAYNYMKRHDDVLALAAGELSEDLIRFVTAELDDEVLDEVDVYRVLDRQDDLASEPITIAVVLGLGTAATYSVGRIVERWIEKKRQHENIELVIEAYKVAPEAGRIVADLARNHSEVSVAYPLASDTPTAGLTDAGNGAPYSPN